MTNGNLETRVGALEAQMQEIRELLQQTAQLQNQLQLQLIQQASNADRIERITESNARAIQAWKALIEQNKAEAEEQRLELKVAVHELIRANQRNEVEHELFRRRFAAIDPLIDDPSQD